MRHSGLLYALLFLAAPGVVHAEPAAACNGGIVFEDRNGDGRRGAGEPGLPGVKVSDGVVLVTTDAVGGYRLPTVAGRIGFVIKPPDYAVSFGPDGLPDFWRNPHTATAPADAHRGSDAPTACRDHALRREPLPTPRHGLEVLVFADPQVKSLADVDHYASDIVRPLVEKTAGDATVRQAQLGISLGDIVDDKLSLYPSINARTALLGVPWLHVAGNHDLDLDAASDQDSLLTFRQTFGPDTFAWEEALATFVVLDDVIHLPGGTPAYIGGLRADQFEFLERYLPTLPRERLLVLAVHIPLFDTGTGRETFRRDDRERLFALLRGFPHVLLLSGHSHAQQHVHHGAASGWHGATPLHEYNVGAASGAYWSGVKDAEGVPDATMSDGTPNGYARLRVESGGGYTLSWHPARLSPADPAFTAAMALHAPRVLRHGAYPGSGVYANVFMGTDDSRVEYRIDDGAWRPMRRVEQADPRLLIENMRDDLADALRGRDRSPEAKASRHLWRGTLPTDLDPGEHRIQVRAFDRWQGEQHAHTFYRLSHVD